MAIGTTLAAAAGYAQRVQDAYVGAYVGKVLRDNDISKMMELSDKDKQKLKLGANVTTRMDSLASQLKPYMNWVPGDVRNQIADYYKTVAGMVPSYTGERNVAHPHIRKNEEWDSVVRKYQEWAGVPVTGGEVRFVAAAGTARADAAKDQAREAEHEAWKARNAAARSGGSANAAADVANAESVAAAFKAAYETAAQNVGKSSPAASAAPAAAPAKAAPGPTQAQPAPSQETAQAAPVYRGEGFQWADGKGEQPAPVATEAAVKQSQEEKEAEDYRRQMIETLMGPQPPQAPLSYVVPQAQAQTPPVYVGGPKPTLRGTFEWGV